MVYLVYMVYLVRQFSIIFDILGRSSGKLILSQKESSSRLGRGYYFNFREIFATASLAENFRSLGIRREYFFGYNKETNLYEILRRTSS